MGGQYWYGIMLSLSGCTLSNLGVNVQKRVHLKLAKKKKLVPVSTSSYVLQPVWLLGFSMVILGSIADLISFAFASMSLLAPLGAMTLVINMFVAPCFGERLTRKDVICTLVIFGGTVVSLVFGSKEDRTYNVQKLLDLYLEWPFILYAVFFLLYLVGTALFLRRAKARRNLPWKHDGRIERVLWPSLAGAFGAHSVLFAKSVMEIFKSVRAGDPVPWKNAIPYLVLVGLGSSLVLQMKFLNVGLKKADALFIVPVYQVCWVIMNTVVGMIYFQDLHTMSGLQIAMFFLGVTITLSGVYVLSGRKQRGSSGEPSSATGSTAGGGGKAADGSGPGGSGIPGSGSGAGKGGGGGDSDGEGGTFMRSGSGRLISPNYLIGLRPHVELIDEDDDDDDDEGNDVSIPQNGSPTAPMCVKVELECASNCSGVGGKTTMNSSGLENPNKGGKNGGGSSSNATSASASAAAAAGADSSGSKIVGGQASGSLTSSSSGGEGSSGDIVAACSPSLTGVEEHMGRRLLIGSEDIVEDRDTQSPTTVNLIPGKF